MDLYNKIYLIGFMGSGKSTTGKKLATQLGWTFVDLDDKVEQNTGLSISKIFSEKGEDYFREIEAGQLRSLESTGNLVIATGGGTPCFNDNMDLMKKSGLTIYLKMTPPQLRKRLYGSSEKRPLIKNLNSDQLLTFIKERLVLREKWYNRSEIIVDGMCININLLLSQIKQFINHGKIT